MIRSATHLCTQIVFLALLVLAAGQPAGTAGASRHTVYFPLVGRSQPAVFGVAVHPGVSTEIMQQAQNAGVGWVRAGEVVWAELEPTPGQRRWERLAPLEDDLRDLEARGLTPVVNLLNTPAWAQAQPGVLCGPIQPEAFDAFAAFTRDLIERLSAPPFSVHHWIIWNEPDIDPQDVPPNVGYGCWGDKQDAYYGGARYAALLERIYPVIKRADPQAQVIMGGLLLDCDPEHPPAGRDCASAHFLEGVLRAGGASYVDALAYHGYAYWTLKQEDWDKASPNWAVRGGAVHGKLAFIRALMVRYGVDKPVMLDEAGLLCYRSDPVCQENFYQAQAEYTVRLYTRAWAAGLQGVMWYTLSGPGWQNSGLLDAQQRPRPAYHALQFLGTRLANARYVGSLSQGAIEGYAFVRGLTRYEIYWTNSSQQVPLALQSGVVALYNAQGSRQPIPAHTLVVGFVPQIVEYTLAP